VLEWSTRPSVIDTPEPRLCEIYRSRLAASASQ
jgi:hypothetical protein